MVTLCKGVYRRGNALTWGWRDEWHTRDGCLTMLYCVFIRLLVVAGAVVYLAWILSFLLFSTWPCVCVMLSVSRWGCPQKTFALMWRRTEMVIMFSLLQWRIQDIIEGGCCKISFLMGGLLRMGVSVYIAIGNYLPGSNRLSLYICPRGSGTRSSRLIYLSRNFIKISRLTINQLLN